MQFPVSHFAFGAIPTDVNRAFCITRTGRRSDREKHGRIGTDTRQRQQRDKDQKREKNRGGGWKRNKKEMTKKKRMRKKDEQEGEKKDESPLCP